MELVDREYNHMTLTKEANCLRIEVHDGVAEGASFLATGTQVGKLLEFVVEMFFPPEYKESRR